MSYLLAAMMFAVSAVQGQVASDLKMERFATPVDWKVYKVSPVGTSFMMPKLPVTNILVFKCSEKWGTTYHSYAAEAVYEFRFYLKERKVPGFCLSKERFSSALNTRLNELRNFYKPAPVSETDGEVNGRKVKIFRWVTERDQATRWVFMDTNDSQWVELAVNSRLDVKPAIKTFLDSLNGSAMSGIEVGSGSSSNLGDSGPIPKPVIPAGTEPTRQSSLIMSKPRPVYTDAARDKNIEGIVQLDVEFLANGGIGEITVVKALSHGLTEQAVAAARRLIFLPARENGVPVTSIKKVEYEFKVL